MFILQHFIPSILLSYILNFGNYCINESLKEFMLVFVFVLFFSQIF